MTKDEAMKLALTALKKSDDFLYNWHENLTDDEADAYSTARQLNELAITALREALAEPTSADYAMGYAEGFNDACKPAPVAEPRKQEPGRNHWEDGDVFDRIAAIKEQPAQQEPVAWMQDSIELYVQDRPSEYYTIPLYTAPPTLSLAQRKPLTHEQRVDLLAKFEAHKHEWHAAEILIDMVEAAHGIKENT